MAEGDASVLIRVLKGSLRKYLISFRHSDSHALARSHIVTKCRRHTHGPKAK